MGGSKDNFTLEIIGASSWQQFKDYWYEKIEQWNDTYPDEKITAETCHIDHIKPVSAFRQIGWAHGDPHHISNLQPTSERVNRGLKNDKWSDDDEEYWKQNIYKQDERREIYLPKDCKYVPPEPP